MGSRRLHGRLARLEQRVPAPVPPPPEDKERRKRLERMSARLGDLITAAGELMSEEESQRVGDALDLWSDRRAGPYAGWFGDLAQERCRLPDLAPAAMKAVLLAWLSPECDWGARVCRQCGLEYPCHKSPPLSEWKVLPGKIPLEGPPPWYDLPDFFEACPGCGASLRDFDWASLVDDSTAPWKTNGSGPRQ
jgi:hypothetical protein